MFNSKFLKKAFSIILTVVMLSGLLAFEGLVPAVAVSVSEAAVDEVAA